MELYQFFRLKQQKGGGGGQMVSACDSGSNDSVRRRFESPRRWDIRAEVRNPSIGLGIRRPPKSSFGTSPFVLKRL